MSVQFGTVRKNLNTTSLFDYARRDTLRTECQILSQGTIVVWWISLPRPISLHLEESSSLSIIEVFQDW